MIRPTLHRPNLYKPTQINFGQSTYSSKLIFIGGPSTWGWGSRTDKKTVSVLCQSDRHFLAFSDTTRNECHRKSN